jgi:hypothetical protein
VEQRTDETAATPLAPWWLRPPAGVAVVVLLVLFNRWIGGGLVVALATLVLAGSVLVLALAVLLPGFRARWFG